MKKSFLLIILLFSSGLFNRMKADGGEFEIGINYGKLKVQNVNRTVYVYNYTRQWLTQKMDYFNWGHGLYITYGKMYEKVGITLGFSGCWQKNIAYGKEPSGGAMGYRKLTVGCTTIPMAIPIRLIENKHFELNFVPSLDMKFNYVSSQYSNDSTFSSGDNNMVAGSLKIGSTLGLAMRLFPVNWFALSIKPFYSVNFAKTDVGGMQKDLQGSRIEFDVPDPFTVAGITLSIVLTNRGNY